MNSHRLEVADVVRSYAQDFLNQFGNSVSLDQRRVLKAVAQCRTAALGGHVEACDGCGHRRVAYNSCRNRHCPKCQAMARAAWMEERTTELLPVQYFHVVFTLPENIALLALQNPRIVYGILLQASAQTLLQVAADPKHLGAEIGFLSILHTWGQNLLHHPHVHCVVPGGGFAAKASKWCNCRKDFFLPVRILSRVFRGKFIDLLKRAYRRGEIKCWGTLTYLADPRQFEFWLDAAVKTEWVVFAKPPFGGPAQVLKYLARYTHRVAISNNRLISVSNGQVHFRWKDYAQGNTSKTMVLAATEFVRRFLLHVLPRGFVKIRYFGFLGSRVREKKLALARLLIAESTTASSNAASKPDLPVATWEPGCDRCPACKQGRMVLVERLFPLRAPYPPASSQRTTPLDTS